MISFFLLLPIIPDSNLQKVVINHHNSQGGNYSASPLGESSRVTHRNIFITEFVTPAFFIKAAVL